MARFLLIHGAAHGAWCWRDVLPALRDLGHEATAIDLPSHGDDPTAPEGVTLSDYARAVAAAIQGPTIVVGHSMGGYPITLAAEMAPENIAGLVYLCAYTPWPGLGLAEMRKLAPTQPLVEAIRMADDRKTMTFDPDMAFDKFYHDCPQGTLDYALPRLSRQPVAPMETSVEGTQNPPRHYIICADDHAIPPEFQRQMAAQIKPANVHELPSGHSPFFAMPERVADVLDEIARNTLTLSSLGLS